MKTICLVLALCLFISCNSLGFTLDPKKERCFSEHMDEYVLTKGKYTLYDNTQLAGEATNVDVTVYDPSESVIYNAKDIRIGKFAFNTPVSGTYRVCFENKNVFAVDMFFKYKYGIDAKDYTHLAQLQNLEEVEVQTQWIVDSLYEVQETIDVIEEHEEEIRRIAKDLDAKLLVFSGITIVVLIVLSLLQTYMLKRRLVKAKLL